MRRPTGILLAGLGLALWSWCGGLAAAATDGLRHDCIVVMSALGVPPLGTGSFTTRGQVSGATDLDRLCRQCGIVAIEPFYPGKLRRAGLARVAARLRVLRLAPGDDAADIVERFAGLSCLASAELPTVPRLYYTPNDPAYAQEWYLPHVNAPAAWDHIHGAAARPAVVGVIDTRINLDHPDLAENIWINEPEDINHNGRLDAGDIDGLDQDGNGFIDDVAGWNFTDNNPLPTGSAGHGNAVAACISEVTDNGLLGAAIGFGVRLMALQAITDGAQLVEGYVPMLYAADNGAGVVNCSWGIAFYREFEQAIVNAVWQEDVLIVAAGGDGSQVVYPAGYDHVMAVGATDEYDHRAVFGPWGEYIDICAPGVNILTLYGEDLTWVSGTSFASGMVAGLAGLLRAWRPEYSAAQVERTIEETAVNIDALNPGFAGLLGAGRIDALAAIEPGLAGVPTADGGQHLFCHPNPFNASTVAGFTMGREEDAELAVFDARGRRVATLVQGNLEAGYHSATWDAQGLPSGTYFLRLIVGGACHVQKVSLVK